MRRYNEKFFVTSASGGERHIGLDKEREQETVGPNERSCKQMSESKTACLIGVPRGREDWKMKE